MKWLKRARLWWQLRKASAVAQREWERQRCLEQGRKDFIELWNASMAELRRRRRES